MSLRHIDNGSPQLEQVKQQSSGLEFHCVCKICKLHKSCVDQPSLGSVESLLRRLQYLRVVSFLLPGLIQALPQMMMSIGTFGHVGNISGGCGLWATSQGGETSKYNLT